MGLIDGIHDSLLVTAIGQSLACQREVGDAQECQCETEQCREFLDTSSKFQDLLSLTEIWYRLQRLSLAVAPDNVHRS